MRIKRIRKLKVNSFTFSVKWNKAHNGGCFDYADQTIEIGTKDDQAERLLMVIMHEVYEICAIEMHVRLRRPDVDSDYIFVYDHRQHETMCNMAAGLLSQFID